MCVYSGKCLVTIAVVVDMSYIVVASCISLLYCYLCVCYYVVVHVSLLLRKQYTKHHNKQQNKTKKQYVVCVCSLCYGLLHCYVFACYYEETLVTIASAIVTQLRILS